MTTETTVRRRVFALVAMLLVAGGVAVGTGGTAPVRVIDRTFACSVAPHAGVRFIEVSATTGFRDPDDPKRWKWGASMSIRGARVFFANALAGAPIMRVTRWVTVDAATCRPVSARVPLSRRGLVGGAASQLQGSDLYRCVTPARVLLRVRAVFRTPTMLRVQRLYSARWFTTSDAAIAKEVKLALRTESGKLLAYTEIFESGKARLFAASICAFE